MRNNECVREEKLKESFKKTAEKFVTKKKQEESNEGYFSTVRNHCITTL